MRTVIFPSGGAATTAMLGGHIDVVPLSAAFAASMLRQQQVRILAVTAPARLPEVLADVPTWREQGIDTTLSNWRALIGPRGMSAAQVAFWEGVMRRLMDSPEWKAELERNFWSAELLRATELRKLFEHDQADVKAFLVELGLAK
jgi:putative tricarboxylic transport membrane protein